MQGVGDDRAVNARTAVEQPDRQVVARGLRLGRGRLIGLRRGGSRRRGPGRCGWSGRSLAGDQYPGQHKQQRRPPGPRRYPCHSPAPSADAAVALLMRISWSPDGTTSSPPARPRAARPDPPELLRPPSPIEPLLRGPARLGRPVQVVNEIVRGKKAITDHTALGLEKVLGIPATFWVNLEQEYRMTPLTRAAIVRFARQPATGHCTGYCRRPPAAWPTSKVASSGSNEPRAAHHLQQTLPRRLTDIDVGVDVAELAAAVQIIGVAPAAPSSCRWRIGISTSSQASRCSGGTCNPPPVLWAAQTTASGASL